MGTMKKWDYLDAREKRMLEQGEFFGGWEDADGRRTELEPLEKFDRPELHQVRMGQPEWVPEEAIASQMRKAMAGAPKSERVDASVLKEGTSTRPAWTQTAGMRRRYGGQLPNLGDAPTVHGMGAVNLRAGKSGSEELRWKALLGAMAESVGGRPAAAASGATAAPAMGHRRSGTESKSGAAVGASDGCRKAGPALTDRRRGCAVDNASIRTSTPRRREHTLRQAPAHYRRTRGQGYAPIGWGR